MSLKIALVGTGKVARDGYLPYLAAQPDLSLWYYSRTPEKAAACARDFGGQVAGSIGELLAAEPDAVLVLTPESQRYPATLALLEQGRPRRLFFEKPLVAQRGQADVGEDDFFKARALLQRAAQDGVETAMVFNYRFFDQTLRARQIVAERGFGQLTQATLLVHYACWSHCLDLLALFGSPAATVSALAGERAFQGVVDVAGSFRLLNGASGTLLGTNGTGFDASLYQLHLVFEGGSLHFSDLDGPLQVCDHASRYCESHNLIGNYSRWHQYQASFAKALAAYLESVRRAAPPPVPGLAGLQELQFEAALRRSIAQGRPVDVQAEFPLEV